MFMPTRGGDTSAVFSPDQYVAPSQRIFRQVYEDAQQGSGMGNQQFEASYGPQSGLGQTGGTVSNQAGALMPLAIDHYMQQYKDAWQPQLMTPQRLSGRKGGNMNRGLAGGPSPMTFPAVLQNPATMETPKDVQRLQRISGQNFGNPWTSPTAASDYGQARFEGAFSGNGRRSLGTGLASGFRR